MVVILFGGYIMQSIRNKITAIVILFSILNCGSKIFAATAMKNRQRLIKENRRIFPSTKTEKKRKEIADRIVKLHDEAKELKQNIDQKKVKVVKAASDLKSLKDERDKIANNNTFKYIENTRIKSFFAKAKKIIAQVKIMPEIHLGIKNEMLNVNKELNELFGNIAKKNHEDNDLKNFLLACQTHLETLKLKITKLISRAQAYNFTNYNKKSFIYSVQNIQRAMMKLQNKKDTWEKLIAHKMNGQKSIGVVRERGKQQKTDFNRPTKKIKPDETTEQEVHEAAPLLACFALMLFKNSLEQNEATIKSISQ